MKTHLLKWTNDGKEQVVELELGETCKVLSVTDAPIVNRNKQGKVEPKKIEPKKVEQKKPKPCGGCGKNKLRRLIEGSAGLLKAELGIDAADEETIAERKAICLGCESYDFGVCNDCSCFTAAKVKLKSGSPCPQGKW